MQGLGRPKPVGTYQGRCTLDSAHLARCVSPFAPRAAAPVPTALTWAPRGYRDDPLPLPDSSRRRHHPSALHSSAYFYLCGRRAANQRARRRRAQLPPPTPPPPKEVA
ncbi:transmembrane protein 188 [Platysternon megacephalum]|uniref:Transmembrane protein 188 n=1 Tax=Platysternon megacephalum TaxID=55544 RepID=A0A4D9ENI7_9SAUR|nr:transmembrane protein 188 [Platysternon megacephalum]